MAHASVAEKDLVKMSEGQLERLSHLASLNAAIHEVENCMLRAYWCSDGERYDTVVDILDRCARALDEAVPKDLSNKPGRKPKEPAFCPPGMREVNGMCVLK